MSLKKKRADRILEMTARADRYKSLAAGFLVLAQFIVHPLIITNGYSNITATKLYSFLIMISASITALALIQFAASMTIPDYIHWKGFGALLRATRPYERALTAYWLVMLISMILSAHPTEALLGSTNRNEGFLMMTGYILTVMIAGRLYRPKVRDLVILCAVAALISAYGILQYYGMDFLRLNPTQMSGAPGPKLVYVSTMSNRNVLSTYLCLSFSVCAALFSQKKNAAGLACLPMGLIIFYMLILGQTESGYIGLWAAFVILFPFLAGSPKSAARLLWITAGCLFSLWLSVKAHSPLWTPSYWTPLAPFLIPATLVLLGIGALLYLLPKLPEEFPKKPFRIGWYALIAVIAAVTVSAVPVLAESTNHKIFYTANEIMKGNFDDRLGSSRMFIWKRALAMFPDKPLFGYGQDNFYPEFTQRYGEESLSKYRISFDKAHNEHVQVLVDSGGLGLASLLAFYGLSFWGARKHLKNPMALAVLLAMIGFIVQAFFNISTPFVHPLAWLMWGILGSLSYSCEQTRQ